MLAKLYTFSLLGIEAVPVDVEVDVSSAALPKTILVGLRGIVVSDTNASEAAVIEDFEVIPVSSLTRAL